MKSHNLWLTTMALLVILFSSCADKHSQTDQEEVRYVKSASVLPANDNNTVILNGVVKELRQVTLSFKVGGPVQTLLVDAGDYINKGEIIAQIDKRDYRIQVQATKAQYTQAKAEYERYQELYQRKRLPENTLDKLKAGYLMAKSQYEAAENALIDTDLKAPFSGYINKKLIENFETVGPGSPIVELLDFTDLEVVVSIPEGQINQMGEVKEITCDIRNANQFNIPAKVKSLSKKSGNDRMFEAKILLQADDFKSNIKPGMVAKVKVTKEQLNGDGLLVPVESVFSNNQEKYVWIIQANNMQVTKQKVSVLKVHGNGLIEINSKLKAGDKIVTAGVHTLIEGQTVKVLPKKSTTNIGGLL